MIALFVNFVVLINSTVISGSMEETINTDDRVLGFRCAYWLSEPKRGDIVIFEEEETGRYLLKRIIGLPGDTVVIQKGEVLINGEPLQEDYLNVITRGSFGPYEVPEGEYFVMGDNRNNSNDSRYWQYPFITKRQILGKIFLRYYPIPDFRFY